MANERQRARTTQAPPGWWWGAARCTRCNSLVLERVTPRSDAIVPVRQRHCPECNWAETEPG
jgi:hypothetical protein